MNKLVVNFRFSFQGRETTDRTPIVQWELVELDCDSCNFSQEIELEKIGLGSYVANLRIAIDKEQKLLFRFIYDGCDESRIGSYNITKSLQDPLVITEVDRSGDEENTFRFKINYHTYFGQILAVVGSLPELGFWDVKKALKLNHSGPEKRSSDDKGIFTDNRYNWQGDIKLPRLPETVSYRYFVMNECADPLMEPGSVRQFFFSSNRMATSFFEFNDVWRWNEITQGLFAKRLYDGRLFLRDRMVGGQQMIDENIQRIEDDKVLCIFCAHCGMVGKARRLAIVGSIPELGQWNPAKGVALSPTRDLQWVANVVIPRAKFPFEFKVVAVGGADSIVWETHENRSVTLSNVNTNEVVTIDCWHLSFPNLSFHGSGISVDVNSIASFDFNELLTIINWSKKVGFAAVHLVGLLDTTAMGNTVDELPVSGFALNPVFLDCGEYGYKNTEGTMSEILAKKMEIMKKEWNENRSKYAMDVANFREEFGYYLENYEKLCYGRSKDCDYLEEVDPEFRDFVDFVQCMCYQQLLVAQQHARDANIAIAIDIPFAISEKSAEAFGQPELFLTDYSLGIRPTTKNPIGKVMKAYPYNFGVADKWFRERIYHFSKLCSIVRLESTIQYFRQWIVPRKTAVRAVFGHYEPSVNISYAELETWGLWDIERYTQPFIPQSALMKMFGMDSMRVQDAFFVTLDKTLHFKPEFSNEQALVTAVLSPEHAALREKYLDDLLRLMGEVLLIKVNTNEFRPRPVFTLAATSKPGEEKSFSFSELPSYHQSPFNRLEEEFIDSKQRSIWTFNGRKILGSITRSDDVTFFSDASGVFGELCDETLQSVGVMPLRVQLEGRTDSDGFDDIRDYPYLSVASPQREMSVPMHAFWDESREKAEHLWAEEFWESGETPTAYTDEVAVNIMKQHCWSPSMWVMFPIDCLVGARGYINPNKQNKYGLLNLKGFVADEAIASKIRDVLEQTKRK